MKISVVIPTWNRPELLIKCLVKLSEQDISKEIYEVIVVTDGPDMDTCSVVGLLFEKERFSNLHCYSLDEKKGPAAARNKGAEKAKGELIVFTDDDCLPQQDWLSTYYNFYQSVHKTEAAFTGRTIVPQPATPTDYEKNIAHLETAEFITANCAITKKAFEKVNGFDEDFPIASREDSDMHFRIIKNAIPLYTVQDAIVTHPVRKANWGISLKEQKKSLFNALLFKKHTELYREKISARPVWNYYIMIILSVSSLIAFISGYKTVAIITFCGWLLLYGEFTVRRLRSTSKKASHVLEMMFTSFFIPFLSVFWTLYGSVKYKTFFL